MKIDVYTCTISSSVKLGTPLYIIKKNSVLHCLHVMLDLFWFIGFINRWESKKTWCENIHHLRITDLKEYKYFLHSLLPGFLQKRVFLTLTNFQLE